MDNVVYSKTLLKIKNSYHEEEDYSVYLSLTKENNGYMISIQQFTLGKVCLIFDFYRNKNAVIELAVNTTYSVVKEKTPELDTIISDLLKQGYSVED